MMVKPRRSRIVPAIVLSEDKILSKKRALLHILSATRTESDSLWLQASFGAIPNEWPQVRLPGRDRERAGQGGWLAVQVPANADAEEEEDDEGEGGHEDNRKHSGEKMQTLQVCTGSR